MVSIYKTPCCKAPYSYTWLDDHLLEKCSACRKVLATKGIVIHYKEQDPWEAFIEKHARE